MKITRKGKTPSESTIKNSIKARIGKKLSLAQRRNMSLSQQKRVKDGRHHLFNGGITSVNEKIRKSLEYKLWRESVYERDNYTCVFCMIKGKRLNADHIKPFAYYPELRFAIDNGRTLCVECHKKTNNYLNRWIKKQQ